MPANPESLALTDAYGRSLEDLRERTAAMVVGAWVLDFRNLSASFARWLAVAAAALGGGQRAAAGLAADYLAAYRASELGGRRLPYTVDADRYAGVTPDGRPVRRVLSSATVAVRVARERGADEAAAARWGATRAVRAVRTEVAEAARFAQRDLMDADGRIVGWRRVTAGSPCGACLAAATGAVRATSEVPDVHAACRCVAEPVIRGAADRVTRPTGEEMFAALTPARQDALFAGTGGKAKADLIRSGQVALSALILPQPHPQARDWITETPLQALA
jgi:hypothetical protein